MPVQIGAKAHSFSDPTGLLTDCHRRIEMFLGSLQHVANVIDRPLTEEARSALESALRYFRESAPKAHRRRGRVSVPASEADSRSRNRKRTCKLGRARSRPPQSESPARRQYRRRV